MCPQEQRHAPPQGRQGAIITDIIAHLATDIIAHLTANTTATTATIHNIISPAIFMKAISPIHGVLMTAITITASPIDATIHAVIYVTVHVIGTPISTNPTEADPTQGMSVYEGHGVYGGLYLPPSQEGEGLARE